jgi:hypothetical protein
MTDQGPELARAEWQIRLDELTKQHEGHEVAIELLDEEFGDEEEVEWLPLAYIEYDPKDDVVIVARLAAVTVANPVVLRHFVERPQSILVDSLDEGRVALDTVDGDGDHTIVTIQLPRPRRAVAEGFRPAARTISRVRTP